MKIKVPKELVEFAPVVLLVLAIGLSPSFSIGEISTGRDLEIRLEDLLIVLLGSIWIVHLVKLRKSRLEKPPLLFPILVWLGIGFLGLVTNLIFQNLVFQRSFFFFLKEIEFFVFYFYIFYHVKNLDAIKFILKAIIFIGVVHALWIFFQLVTGLKITYFYGPTSFIEPLGTFTSGGFLLILFAFLVQVFLYYYAAVKLDVWKKMAIAALIVTPILGVFTSGSRTAFFGLVFALIMSFTLYFVRMKHSKHTILYAIWVMLLIGTVFGFSVLTSPTVERRLLHLEGISREFNFRSPFSRGDVQKTQPEEITQEFHSEKSGTRADVWKTQLKQAFERPQFLFFGFGKAIILTYGESHNQYVRNFIETGIVGSIIFFGLMFVIIKTAWKEFWKREDSLLVALSAGVLISTATMLFMGLAVDSFVVVKVAELYWFFIALSMTAFYLKKKHRTT